VLWVQGCPFRCPGCFNPEFWEFTGGQPTPVETVVGWILNRDDTEGVTFSGGEPFAHAGVLAAVAAPVRRAGKSVVIFTGYTQEALLQSDDLEQRRLWQLADLLIAGPYRRDLPSRHPWLSSANQELVFLTDRYRPEDLRTGGRRIEFRIAADGTTTVTGFPHADVPCRPPEPEHACPPRREGWGEGRKLCNGATWGTELSFRRWTFSASVIWKHRYTRWFASRTRTSWRTWRPWRWRLGGSPG
jgi:anaerobic ribonucleoside-triphosphate reductase activating protein